MTPLVGGNVVHGIALSVHEKDEWPFIPSISFSPGKQIFISIEKNEVITPLFYHKFVHFHYNLKKKGFFVLSLTRHAILISICVPTRALRGTRFLHYSRPASPKSGPTAVLHSPLQC